jgi:hypothetical protein
MKKCFQSKKNLDCLEEESDASNVEGHSKLRGSTVMGVRKLNNIMQDTPIQNDSENEFDDDDDYETNIEDDDE